MAHCQNLKKKEEAQPDLFELEHKKFVSEDKSKTLFKNLLFFLSRGVPHESLEFTIRSFGGRLTANEDDDEITHHIVDRGTPTHVVFFRDFVIPQWIYDCINFKVLLPIDRYLPNLKEPPPHLSPFVDDEEEGYVPSYHTEIQKHINPTQEDETKSTELSGIQSGIEEDINKLEERFAKELEAEKEGKYEQGEDIDMPSAKEEEVEQNPTKKRKSTAEVEEKELSNIAIALLPNKKRKMLAWHQRHEQAKEEEVNKLWEKRKKAEKKNDK